MPLEPGGVGVQQPFLAHALGLCCLEARNGHHPGVQFHPTLVAFFYGKGQRVIARTLVVLSRERDIPWLDAAGVDDASAHTCLQEHSVHLAGLQLVQYLPQLLLLTFDTVG